MKRNKKGFTIVELVIVIGVIGILSAILIPTFTNLTKNAQDAALKSDLANVYAEYAADAADGKKGEAGAALEMYGQEQVALSKDGTNFYIYNSSASPAGWQVATKTSAQIAALDGREAPATLDVTYNGYTVYETVAE